MRLFNDKLQKNEQWNTYRKQQQIWREESNQKKIGKENVTNRYTNESMNYLIDKDTVQTNRYDDKFHNEIAKSDSQPLTITSSFRYALIYYFWRFSTLPIIDLEIQKFRIIKYHE